MPGNWFSVIGEEVRGGGGDMEVDSLKFEDERELDALELLSGAAADNELGDARASSEDVECFQPRLVSPQSLSSLSLDANVFDFKY